MARGWLGLALTTVGLLVVGAGTAHAIQPIDPLGPQLRLTQQGVDGTPDVDTFGADVAYNSVRNEYLLVWENSSAAGTEIFARRLSADGSPIAAAFQVSGLAGAPAGSASSPAVAYDPERDRYGVVFRRTETGTDVEAWLQMVSGAGQVVQFDGDPGPEPVTASSVGAGRSVLDPDVLYRPDATNDNSPGDRWVVAYAADVTAAGEFEILDSLRRADGSTASTNNGVSDFAGVLGDGFDPSIIAVPGSDDFAIAFEGTLNGADFDIFARRMNGTIGGGVTGQIQITNTVGQARDPAIAADPVTSQVLVAYQADKLGDGDREVGVQRLDFGLGQIGVDDQVVSSAGPPGSGATFTVQSPAVAYNAVLQRYLVSWIGRDTDRPGLSNDELEVQATSLDANGAEAAPEDFLVSRMGADNDEDATPIDTALALNTQTGRWLSVWTSDDARPPLADGEFEVFGRQVGENFDHDGDGSLFPADCDDNDPVRRPGAVDVFENGIDEDCSGADAINLDRDGDGSPRPADCDDGNPAIRPGLPDIANNEVDEDCNGVKLRRIVDVRVERFFAVFRTFTKVTRLRISRLQPGMRIQLRCKGKGCPKALRKGKVRRVTVKRTGRRDFTKLFKRARLKPRAVIDVRVLQTGAIGRVDRFRIRNAKVPRRTLRCLPPGVTRPQSCT